MIHAPRLWLRKVDDTFTITKSNIEDTLMELNKIHPKIEFTAEQEEEGKIAFLDCTIYRNENKLETKVFKKATHTGQYTNFESNQPLGVKLSTIKTLTNRAKLISSKKSDFDEEINYIRNTMELNDFPRHIIDKTIKEILQPIPETKNDNQEYNTSMTIPYEKGISEKLCRKARKFNVSVKYCKNKSLKSKLKTNNIIQNPEGVVYKIECKKECGKVYVGETGRKVEERIKEHKRDANKEEITKNMSGISQHCIQSGHVPQWENTQVLTIEKNYNKRRYKEAIEIMKSKEKTVNKKEEIKNLSFIWESILKKS